MVTVQSRRESSTLPGWLLITALSVSSLCLVSFTLSVRVLSVLLMCLFSKLSPIPLRGVPKSPQLQENVSPLASLLGFTHIFAF